MLISEVRVSQSIGSIFNENLFAAKYRPTLPLKGPGVKSSSIENACGATKQKLPGGKVPISKNLAFLACVSYIWPSIPSKMGMRSTALVGLSALRSAAIFSIILDIAFSCVPKLLKGGLYMYFFQTMVE